MQDSLHIQKNATEFFTVSVEFCAFLSKTSNFSRKAFIDKSLKLLSLLYLKASLLSELEQSGDGYVEKYVTEDDYNRIHSSVTEKLGSLESYFDITEVNGYDSGETVNVSTSECFADVYQDIMNFVIQYRDFEEDDRIIAISECIHSFKEFWGIRVLRLMSELHLVLYSQSYSLNDDYSKNKGL